MKCRHCKKEISDDSVFCEHCGRRVKRNKWPFIIAALLLVSGGVLFYLNYGKGNETPGPSVTVTVKSKDESMGTVKGGGSFKSGAVVQIEATAKRGYRFVCWDDGNKESFREVTADHNQEYQAIFEEKRKVTISVKSNDESMGTVIGGGTYYDDTVVSIIPVANKGCHFVGWGDGKVDNPREVKTDQALELVAYFEETASGPNDTVVSGLPEPLPREVPKYKVTVESSNIDMGTVSGGGTFDSATVVIIEAVAKEGYKFASWMDGNKDKTRKVLVDGNHKYKAQFEKEYVAPSDESKDPSDKWIVEHIVKEKSPKSHTKRYWFGKYEGDMKNGIPDGNGKMYYNCHIQIAKFHSNSPYFAEEGDYFDGYWTNGDINNGRLFDKDGNLKHTIRGKSRTRPYDLEIDEYIK